MTLRPKGTQPGELEQLIETLRLKGLGGLPAPHNLNTPYIPYYYTEAFLQERGHDGVMQHRQAVYRKAVLDNDPPHILEYFKERVELEEAIPKICARVREQLSPKSLELAFKKVLKRSWASQVFPPNHRIFKFIDGQSPYIPVSWVS